MSLFYYLKKRFCNYQFILLLMVVPPFTIFLKVTIQDSYNQILKQKVKTNRIMELQPRPQPIQNIQNQLDSIFHRIEQDYSNLKTMTLQQLFLAWNNLHQRGFDRERITESALLISLQIQLKVSECQIKNLKVELNRSQSSLNEIEYSCAKQLNNVQSFRNWLFVFLFATQLFFLFSLLSYFILQVLAAINIVVGVTMAFVLAYEKYHRKSYKTYFQFVKEKEENERKARKKKT